MKLSGKIWYDKKKETLRFNKPRKWDLTFHLLFPYCSMKMMTEKFTPNPIPCSRIYPAVTCSQAKRFAHPSDPLRRSTIGQSSMSSSQSETCCIPIVSGCWNNPFVSSKKVCCSCLDTDCTDYARSCYTTHGSVRTTTDCEHSLAALSVVMALSWSMSSNRVA